MREVNYPGEDIQKLTFGDSSFDIILSNHVSDLGNNRGLFA